MKKNPSDEKSGKYYKLVKHKNGSIASAEFLPDVQMRLWVVARADRQHKDSSDEALLRRLKWKSTLITDWKRWFDPGFSEWYADAIYAQGSPLRSLLEQIGRENAYKGDYNFWRDLARTHGVISNETVEHKINIGQFTKGLENLSDAELEKRANSMLSASRGVENQGTIDLAGTIDIGGQAGDGDRVGEMQEKPVVLAEPRGDGKPKEPREPGPAVP